MKTVIWLISILILLVAAYNIWAESGKNYDPFRNTAADAPKTVSPPAAGQGKGNLVAFQPFMQPYAYCDKEHFAAALATLFKKARTDSLLKPGSIVVLPENIGSPLVYAGEKASVYQADSSRIAISVIVNAHIFTFIRKLLSAKGEDRISYTLYNMKARAMARIYEEVFSAFSKEYNVIIVAGSIILPQPQIEKGHIKVKEGALYNTIFVFRPDGTLFPSVIRKQVLSADERLFISPGPAGPPAVLPTSAGNLAPMFEGRLQPGGMQNFVAGPSLVAIPASGASGAEKSLLEQDLPPLAGTGIRNGLLVSFSGNLWEKRFAGGVVVLQDDSLIRYPSSPGKSMIVNAWLR